MLGLILIIVLFPVVGAIVIFGIYFLFTWITENLSGHHHASQSSNANTDLMRRMMANITPDTPSSGNSYSEDSSDGEKEKEYFDQDETYGRIPLENLPDMFTFVNDPDTVYTFYYYGVGGLGQRVRIYREGESGRQVSISWAVNGLLVGRDYTTDIGKIEKYGF